MTAQEERLASDPSRPWTRQRVETAVVQAHRAATEDLDRPGRRAVVGEAVVRRIAELGPVIGSRTALWDALTVLLCDLDVAGVCPPEDLPEPWDTDWARSLTRWVLRDLIHDHRLRMVPRAPFYLPVPGRRRTVA